MAFPSELLVGRTSRVTVGSITVDASISESHGLEADTTDHPVETGSDITDNYRKRPRVFTLEAVVTPSPLATGYPLQTAIGSVTSLSKNDDPVLNAWGEIKRYFDEGTLITISTQPEVYENMALVSFSWGRTATNGNQLRFSATAKEVRFASTLTVQAIPEPKKETAKSAKKRGKQNTKEAPKEKSKSALAKAADAIGGLF